MTKKILTMRKKNSKKALSKNIWPMKKRLESKKQTTKVNQMTLILTQVVIQTPQIIVLFKI